MPTQRFFKLKEEKKQAILEAAAHEFSRVPYSMASINQIIKEADISRGSFYTYFEDKDDLMRYMLRDFKENCQERILKVLEQEDGNLFAVPVRVLEEIMEQGKDGLGYQMYQNMLSDLSFTNQNNFLGIQGLLFQEGAYKAFVEMLRQRMDQRYSITAETLCYGVEMAILMFTRALTLYYRNTENKTQLLTMIKNEMLILKAGICHVQPSE